MKAVILLAGKGSRMCKTYGDIHKAMVPLCGHPLLKYLIDNVRRAGIDEIVPVVGYKGEEILSYLQRYREDMRIIPVWNREFQTTNNLVSLLRAQPAVAGEDFIQINGDMIFDYHILSRISRCEGSAVAADVLHYHQETDSPKIVIRKGRIMDLGRHILKEDGHGYAIGIYRFSKELSDKFFMKAKKLVLDNPDMGFHDPLRYFFQDFFVAPCETGEYLWTDVDEAADIKRAEEYVRILENKYGKV